MGIVTAIAPCPCCVLFVNDLASLWIGAIDGVIVFWHLMVQQQRSSNLTLIQFNQVCFTTLNIDLHLLRKNMWQEEVVKVIRPFLQFLKSFDFCEVHNRLALMLDPYFKSLQVVENYVGCENVVHLVVEYEMKKIIPF